jgi:hypothetical protein
MADKDKLKIGGLVFSVLIIIGIIILAVLFIYGWSSGSFTGLGFDKSPAYYSSQNLSLDVKPQIGTGGHSDNTIRVSWTPRTDLISVTNPITFQPVDVNNDMGYIITPFVNGSMGSNNHGIVVLGINTSQYDVTNADLQNTVGYDISSVSNVSFTVRTFINVPVVGNSSSMSGVANPNLGSTRQTFMNFDKSGSMNKKITHLKLHKPMYVRGPDSLKNLNTSSKVFHHGPKAGLFLDNTQDKNDVFQAPF